MFENPNLKYSYYYAYIDVKSEHLKHIKEDYKKQK
jgi:hypothetical protein